MAATGASCIAVASYVSKNSFDADDGTDTDPSADKGRISLFSSRGPSRDNREKPDIAAAGQYLTAALAAGSAEADDGQFADTANRVLSIAGTSMAAPVVAGVVALLLQKRATLTPAQVKEALFNSARKDIHTGSMLWTPHYGHGKIDAAKALQQV
jgi:subtilisin family serine protease